MHHPFRLAPLPNASKTLADKVKSGNTSFAPHIKHSVNTSGAFEGKPYAVKQLISTLSLVQP